MKCVLQYVYFVQQGVVADKSLTANNLQLPLSMSSCESQFSDLEDSVLQTQCENYIEANVMHNYKYFISHFPF